jgi:hypothetical protein
VPISGSGSSSHHANKSSRIADTVKRDVSSRIADTVKRDVSSRIADTVKRDVDGDRNDEEAVSFGRSRYPAYSTCAAGRPDHGSDGAYPSWPAFSCEALCYVDGNCTSAFSIMATFADNTYEGPFGQAGGWVRYVSSSCV